VNAVDPDLRKYFARGGKLLLIGGWADATVLQKVAVNYYNRVVAAVGEKSVRENMRFFMVPGMGHGPGTTGPHNFSFDALTPIEDWKEKGKTPDQLIVSHFADGKEVGKAAGVPVSADRTLQRHGRSRSSNQLRVSSEIGRVLFFGPAGPRTGPTL